MKKPTLQDVATLAGVSTGTVSKYINEKPISKKNHDKINSAIGLLKYTPSPLARSFASGRSFMILLYIIVESPIVESTWQHELPIIHGIIESLKSTKYSLKIEIAATESVRENARHIDEYTRSKFMDGLILLSPWCIDEKLIHPLDYREFPYVMIGGGIELYPHSCVEFDNVTPVHRLVTSMYRSGHHRIALLGGFRSQRHIHMMYRERGYRKALEDLGVPVDENLMRFGDFSLQSGYTLANELLSASSRPSAIVCGNDYIAAGALRAIREHGMRVPDDVQISGFDNSVVSDATNPTITTVRMPAYEIGALATRELLRRLEDPGYVIANQVIPCDIVQKGSTLGDGVDTDAQ